MGRRIEHEKAIIEQMIRLYCRHREKHKTLCPECQHLLAYAHKRLEGCRYGDQKPSCRLCPMHCYAPPYRAKIREVMRYSGLRMLLHHPLDAIRHLIK